MKVVKGHTGKPDIFLPPSIQNRPERRCLFTVAVGDKFQWMFDITIPLMREYCEKHGIIFIVVDDMYRVNEHPCYMKQFINTLWWRFDRVCYVDSDVVIMPHAPNIFEEVPVDKCGAFRELEYTNNKVAQKKRHQMSKDYISYYAEVYNEKMRALGEPIVPLPDNLGEFYYNAGVFICSKETCPHKVPVGDIMQLPTSNHYDQNYFNMMILKHNIPMYDFGYMWNRRRGSRIKGQLNPLDAYFVHYLGIKQKINLKRDLRMIKKARTAVNNKPTSLRDKRLGIDKTNTQSDTKERRASVVNPTPLGNNTKPDCVFIITVGKSYKWMFDITVPLIKEYCANHGLDLFIADDDWRNDEHPCYMKQLIQFLLWRYRRVLYMDTDILIMPDSPNLFDLVPFGYCGAYQVPENPKILRKKQTSYMEMYNERMWALGAPEYTIPEAYMERYYNAGVFLCDRSCNPHTPVINDTMRLPTSVHYDQDYFNLMINGNDIPMFNLPEAWNKSVSKRINESAESLFKKAHFVHYMGDRAKKRLARDEKVMRHLFV